MPGRSLAPPMHSLYTLVTIVALMACGHRETMKGPMPKNNGSGDRPLTSKLPNPFVNENRTLVAGYYEVSIVRASGKEDPYQIGFAVIDSDDKMQPGSLAPVSEDNPSAVEVLLANAKAFLSKGTWRSMLTPGWRLDGGREYLDWADANLELTRANESGTIWFNERNNGDHVYAQMPGARTLITARGCDYHPDHGISLEKYTSGYDPTTRLAFIVFSIIESADVAHEPFTCDPSVLVHVLRVAPPDPSWSKP